MRHITIALGVLLVILIAIWVWVGQNDGRPAGGAQQPSPHAIDQNG